MTKRIVAKFGGTSLADAPTILKSLSIVRNNPLIKIVVVSAFSGITNKLIKLYEKPDFKHAQKIIEIHETICHNLKCKVDLSYLYESLLLPRTSLSDEMRDAFLSLGEQLSSKIVTDILKELGQNVVEFDIRKVLITDDSFGSANAKINMIGKLAKREILPILASNTTIVTQGFIGCTEDGKTTTLGRGGSDYSAALLAEAIDADRLEIWTDVQGIYTLDPKISNEAKKIEELSFFEAAELANFGAKILHPQTLIPAIRSRIPIYVGASQFPHLKGTWIQKQVKDFPDIRAIAIKRNQTLVTLKSIDMLNTYNFSAKVFQTLAAHKFIIDVVTTSEINISLTLNGPKKPISTILKKLEEDEKIFVEEGLSLITLIGNKLSQNKEIHTLTFQILQEYNIRLIHQKASNHNLSFLVEDQVAESITKILHEQLITKKVFAL